MGNLQESFKSEEKKYPSVMQEFRRHFTVKKKLRNNFEDVEAAWPILLDVIRRAYKLPKNESLSAKKTFAFNKQLVTVAKFMDTGTRKEIALEMSAQDKSARKEYKENKFTTGFVVNKKLMSKGVLIRYTEHIYAHEELFGLRASLAKFGFRQEVKKNKKLYERDLAKLSLLKQQPSE